MDEPRFVCRSWSWEAVLDGAARPALAAAMAGPISKRRWFGAKARSLVSLEIVDTAPISEAARWLLVRTHFAQGADEVYQVVLAFAESDATRQLAQDADIWLRVESPDGRRLGVLYDALANEEFRRQLLEWFQAPRTLRGPGGELIVTTTPSFEAVRRPASEPLTARVVSAEQSNTSVIYGDRMILKLFRRVEQGVQPDVEISSYLTRRNFAHAPRVLGALEYRAWNRHRWSLAMLQAYVPNQGDAWSFTLRRLDDSLAKAATEKLPQPAGEGMCATARRPIPSDVRRALGDFLARVELLGALTGELHLALAADPADPAFAVEPFSDADRRRFYERAGEAARTSCALLTNHLPNLPAALAEQARRVLAFQGTAVSRFEQLAAHPIEVTKIRCHGDYHLGQVLVTADDYVIIDFEGEPARPLAERREKQLALRDVAGMIRSFHYAASAAAAAAKAGSEADRPRIDGWAHAWYAWSCAAFLASYRRTAGDAGFLPRAIVDFERLLDACLLDKALYELRYELNNRPDWVYLPLVALEELLGRGTS
jgi:maltose alpha-D-glucosyltransferase/alpha-amylase